VNELKNRLAKQGISVKLTTSARNYLLNHGYDSLNGVRPMRRLLQDTLEDHIAVELIKGSYDKGSIVEVGTKNRELAYSVISE